MHCCTEIKEVVNKKEQSTCITEHEGFEAVCLNVWVLQTAYFSYWQRHSNHDIRRQPIPEYVHIHLIHNAVIPIGNIDSLLTGNSLVAGDGLERKSE